MKAAQFEYHAPTSVDEVVALLDTYGDEAKLLAGGQSLVPMLALRLTRFAHLIDLNRVEELHVVSLQPDSLEVGAMTRQTTAEHSSNVQAAAPLLSPALPLIGHFQIRNRGTIGGSLAHADPASELPAVVLALSAEIEVAGPKGRRRIPASEFFVSLFETALAPDEVLTSLALPRAKGHAGFAIEEIAWRRGDFAIAGVACALELDDGGAVSRVAISLMGMAPTPTRARTAEEAMLGQPSRMIDTAAIAETAIAGTSPADDVHTSAAYRKRVARTLVERAVGSALEEAVDG